MQVVGPASLLSRFQKKAAEARQCGLRGKCVCEVTFPERKCCVCVKPKVHWKSQKFEEVRNMDHLRKTGIREHCGPKREPMGAPSTPSAVGVEPPNFFGVKKLAPMLHMELQDLIFALWDFGLALVLFICITLFVTFGIEVPILCY